MYFWGQKYQKPPHVVVRGRARPAALHGARKIRPMRHPVTDASQPAPSFSASNESADLLCRQRRHYYTMRSGSPYQLTCPARLRLRVTFVSQNQPPSQLHFFFFRNFLFPQGDSRLGSDGEKADGRLKAPAAGTVCLQTRAVARRRFQASGRRHRNRSGGFCCFSQPSLSQN